MACARVARASVMGGASSQVGFVRKHVDVWDGVVLQGHPLHDTLVSYMFEGVSVNELLIASHRQRSMGCPYNVNKFQGAVFANHMPPAHAGFVDAEMPFVIAQGCVAKRKDVRGRAGPEWPRLIQVLSVEETKITRDFRHPAAEPVVSAGPLHCGYGSQCSVGGLLSRFLGRFLRFSPYPAASDPVAAVWFGLPGRGGDGYV